MTDLLTDWWVHDVSVKRLSGSGAGGDVYADPATITGFWNDGTKLVRDQNGQEVVSSAQFAFASTYARIPAGSRVTAPAAFGGREYTVVASSLGDAGSQPVPSHHEVAMR